MGQCVLLAPHLHPSSLSGSSCCPGVALPGWGPGLQVTHRWLTFTCLCLRFKVQEVKCSLAQKAPGTRAWYTGVAPGMQVALPSLPPCSWVGGKANQAADSGLLWQENRDFFWLFSTIPAVFSSRVFALVSTRRAFEKS